MKLSFLIFTALGLLAFAGGCQQVQTLGPEDFLFAYRCGSLPDQPGSGKGQAIYEGKDEQYHYISRKMSPAEQFVENPFMTGRCRCPVNLLPEKFPENFDQITDESFESSEDTRQYVMEYLMKNKKPSQPAPLPPIEHAPLGSAFKEPADPTPQEMGD